MIWLYVASPFAVAAFLAAFLGFRWQSRKPTPAKPPERNDGYAVTSLDWPAMRLDMTDAEIRETTGAIGTHHNPALWADTPEEGAR